MTLRIRLKSTWFGKTSDSMRPWYAGILSLGFHGAALLAIIVIVNKLPVARSPWFDHATVRYLNLSSFPPAAVYYVASAATPASESKPPADLPRLPAMPASKPPVRASLPALVLPDPLPQPPPTPSTAISALLSGLSGPLSIQPPTRSNEIRVLHPENGHFDVVLVQGGSPEEAAEVPQFRNGPVYTAYLNVGMQKQWVLHYCANDPDIQISDYVVRIGAIQKLEAPYPRVTIAPADLPDAGERIALSGLLDAEGKLHQVHPLGSSDPQYCARLTPLLAQWQFRPAKKAGTPSDVAVVLVVPPR
jgi:hypothetical protein